MVIIGLSIGMQPIMGFNFGAGMMDRVIKTLNTGLTIAIIFMLAIFLISEIATTPIIRLFSDEISLNEMAIVGLRICAWTFPVMAVQTTLTNFFQSIGEPKTSIVLSLIRQIGFLIPLIFILPELFNLGLNGIWLSIPLADFIACIVTVFIYLRFRHQEKYRVVTKTT